jgi:succinate-semialdehyde dehydrogenase/glutarate-semialdehyde dehydrogenase
MSTGKLKTLYKSINPLNNVLFHEAAMTSDAEVETKIARAFSWYQKTRHGGREAVELRFEKLSNVHALLEQRAPELAKVMTMEMGKPYGQSLAEV